MMLIPFRAGASVEEVGGQVSGTIKKCFSHASLGSMPRAILTSSGSRRICCAMRRASSLDRRQRPSGFAASCKTHSMSHPANLSTFSFIFGSLAFLRAGAVTARGVNKRIAGRAPERALFGLMSVQRGFVSRTNHSRTGISCERLIFSISISRCCGHP
jgi:hypothetical protein